MPPSKAAARKPARVRLADYSPTLAELRIVGRVQPLLELAHDVVAHVRRDEHLDQAVHQVVHAVLTAAVDGVRNALAPGGRLLIVDFGTQSRLPRWLTPMAAS